MVRLIRPADPQYRRQLFYSVLLVALVGALGLWWCLGYLDRLDTLSQTDPREALRRMNRFFQWLVALGMIDLGSGGAFILWLGQKTLNAGCYPPPEVPVFRNTPVIDGPQARRRGLLLFTLGNFILTGALLGGFALLWWLRSQ